MPEEDTTRSQNGSVGYVTFKGECFELEFQRKEVAAQYDGVFYLFRLNDLAKRRGERLLQLFRSGQVKLWMQDYESRIETVRINAIRRAFDNGLLSFDAPYDEHTYKQLSLKSEDFAQPNPATDEEIRAFILLKAYWVGYRYNPHPGNERYPIQFDELIDCDYLGVSAEDIRRNVWVLEGQGLIEKVLEGLGRPTSQLVMAYESKQRERVSLESIAGGEKMVESAGMEEEWDVFVSHAHEDKDEIARPLVTALSAKGLRVWYDEIRMKLGDSLRGSIDRGLARSRFGVVILSPNFFAKHWTTQELNGLAARESAGKKVILPVWHRVGHAEISKYSPTLADKIAVSTERGLERVVAAIMDALEETNAVPGKNKEPHAVLPTPEQIQTRVDSANVSATIDQGIGQTFMMTLVNESSETMIVRKIEIVDQRSGTRLTSLHEPDPKKAAIPPRQRTQFNWTATPDPTFNLMSIYQSKRANPGDQYFEAEIVIKVGCELLGKYKVCPTELHVRVDAWNHRIEQLVRY